MSDPRVGEGLRNGERHDGTLPDVAEEDAKRLSRLEALDRLGLEKGQQPGPEGELLGVFSTFPHLFPLFIFHFRV